MNYSYSKSYTVLLIEDNPADTQLVRERLKEQSGFSSFKILHASTLSQGIELLKNSEVDLILLDLNLPETDGLETVQRIRSANSTLPLVVLTATEDEPLALEAIKMGAQDYLPKAQMSSILLTRILKYAVERVGNERRRQETERKYQMFVHGATGLAFILLDLQGCVTHWNEGAERLFQYSEEEAVGKYFGFLFTPEDQKQGRPEAELRSAEHVEKGDDDNWVVRSDGTRFWASGAVTAVRDETDRLIGFAKVVRDKTAQKEASDQLTDLNRTLEDRVKQRTLDLVDYQERLRSMAAELNLAEQRERRRLAADLHDYLAQLLVVCRMKLSEGQSLTNPKDLFAVIQESDEILDKCLTYTRTLVSELSPSCLYEMGLPAALEWLAGDMKKQGLNVLVTGTDCRLCLPEDQAILLFQCTRELLFNVLKHAGVHEARLELAIHGDSLLYIQVEDKGLGFKERKVQAKGSFSDKFGLFSIRERIEAIGGKVNISSVLGEGTLAELTVPLISTKQKDLPETEDSEESSTSSRIYPRLSKSKKIRLLLVDDAKIVREGLKHILSNQQDLSIIGEAENGREAVRLCQTLHPDVVVMDLYMPGMDGLKATRLIKRADPHIAVIGLSVHDSPEVARWFQEAGADAFVAKGGPAELIYLIRKHSLYQIPS